MFPNYHDELLFRRLLSRVQLKAQYTSGVLYVRPVDVHGFVQMCKEQFGENDTVARIILYLKDDWERNFIEFHYD